MARSAVVVAVLVMATGCDLLPTFLQPEVKGNGVRQEQPRQVGTISSLQVDGDVDVVLAVGPASLTIKGDENLLGLVELQEQGGRLSVQAQQRMSPNVELYLTVPSLSAVEVSGGSSLVGAVSTSSNAFSVTVSGGANLNLEGLQTQSLTVSCQAGNALLEGQATSVRMDLAGGANLLASELIAQAVDVKASGGSSAQVHASQSIKAELTGSSHLRVHGSPPERSVNTDSGSSINFQ